MTTSSREDARSDLSEAAIVGIRQMAQAEPDTVLVSCNGQEARLKLPIPPQGGNLESNEATTSNSNGTDNKSDLKLQNTSDKSSSQAKEASLNRLAGSRQFQGEPRQGNGVKDSRDKPVAAAAGAATGVGAIDKHPKLAPLTSLGVAGEVVLGPPRSRPAHGGPAAPHASGARAGAAGATPTSATAAHPVQKTSEREGNSAMGGKTSRKGQIGVDTGMPSNNPRGQAVATKTMRRNSAEAETPEMKRQKMEQTVQEMAKEEQRATAAAAAATEALARARKHYTELEATQAKVAKVERELQAAKEQLHQKHQEQAEELECIKQEQARQMQEPTQAVKAAEEALQQAQKKAEEASKRVFAMQQHGAPDCSKR